MKPKVSIVIPTYIRHDKLQECLRSIVEYTNMDETEVIVVANGASEDSREVYREFPNVTLLWYPEPLGYPKACNHGIRAAKGDYIVLLNDDTQLLSQSRNEWIDVMLQPMLDDGAVGVTGPLEVFDENSKHNFLIFFCVMIRKQCFDEVGLLDEGFAYFGEDTAFCIEAEKKGWKVVRVPEEHPTALIPLDPSTTSIETWKHDKVHTGKFRIWHDAESTIGRIAGCDEVLNKSRARLRELYGNPDDINIHRAMVTDGWIAHDELVWLARQAKACGPEATIIQIGAWQGKSSRAISDNMGEGARLIDVDSWNGSSGEPDAHATAKEREGDGVFQRYYANQFEHILAGKVVPLRMLSVNAAETLKAQGVQADMIFIDGDHSEQGIQTDIDAWLPLLKQGGLLCGHDYYKEHEGPHWVHVRQTVEARFPNVNKSATSIWHVRPDEQVERGHVYDAFIFNDELDVLEIRLSTLDAVVDRFVLVEGTLTHAGHPKPLHFDENKERFAKWLPKITHIVVDDWPADAGNIYDNAWAKERWQRDAIMHGLRDCHDSDIVILGDADEIPNPDVVASYAISQGLVRLKQRMFYYFLNCENKEGWDWQKIAPYKLVRQLTPCGIRYPPAGEMPLIENGGWHFSFLGDSQQVIKKLTEYSHQEFNRPDIINNVEAKIAAGEDIFGRDLKYELVEIDDNYPAYVKTRKMELLKRGLIRAQPSALYDYATELVENMNKTVSNVIDFKQPFPKNPTITVVVSTKDRYTTTLPLCLSAILSQTHRPNILKLYDDGEQLDLSAMPPFDGLLHLAASKGIEWEVFKTPKLGQVTNYQHCLEMCATDLIWRVDDDEIPEPNCLEKLLEEMKEGVGAVAGLVHNPERVSPLPPTVTGKLADVTMGLNVQWFSWNSGPREVEHLYSTFIFDARIAKEVGGYPMNLSPVGHREESWFSSKIHRAGYKLIVTPHAKTWHLRAAQGGIRSYSDVGMWEHDEHQFQQYLRAIETVPTDTKLIVADYGLGDTLLLRGVFSELRRQHPDRKWTIALCYPEVFKDVENVTIISIAEAKALVGNNYDDYSLFRWCWDNNRTTSLVDSMKEFYGCV